MSRSDARKRLVELSKERGASLARLSELLGRNPSYLQQFIKKGSPRKLEEGDRKTLAEFFGVNESELGGLEGVAKEKSYMTRSSVPEAGYIDVPRLNIGASAGPGALPDSEEPFDAFHFSRKWLREQGLEGSKLSAITVEGDSMEPLLNDGDEILIDTAARPFRDGVHVVRLGDTLMVKRVAQAGAGRFSLLSQNLAYPPVDVAADEMEVIGRVVWKGGRI
ncbi:LexA family transcriptional regulator [uncultured Erythrobacter sp.]|uniref:LexA family transcriptional regulator n=2 Tax=uncultured Erythrobacter sp. TaxID=263913 RepID=UPI00261207C0|nr:LexA family transcriptional regulator [uncultured Erythrobacter sp.]